MQRGRVAEPVQEHHRHIELAAHQKVLKILRAIFLSAHLDPRLRAAKPGEKIGQDVSGRE